MTASSFALIFGLLGLGTQEIVLIVLLVLVLFGARKIPEFAKGLGQGIREFRNAAQNVKEEIRREADVKDVAKPLQTEVDNLKKDLHN